MDAKELEKILTLHSLWIKGEAKGVRANLFRADLSRANLFRADLSGANLIEANLSRANLIEANLSGADLLKVVSQRTIAGAGVLTVYKKIQDGIATLEIPKPAKRLGGVVGRKCRAEYAKVLSIEDFKGKKIKQSVDLKTGKTKYVVGKIVRPDSYDDNPLVECSNGIHFFITRKEAEDFNL